MPYSPDSRFAYPTPYHPKSSLELSLVSNESAMPAEVRDKGLSFASPRLLLLDYSDSHIGRWHNEQTARYSNFHKDLPESVVPHISSVQQEFGRVWLKTFALFGEQGFIEGDNPATIHDRFPLLHADLAKEPTDTQATDLHPVGHMVRTSVLLDEILRMNEGTSFELSPLASYLTRSAMAIHDIGENEHPAVALENGGSVGDISSATGKTAADRALERKILESILREEFSDYFDQDMVQILSALIGHRPNELDPEYTYAHSQQEIAHNLNSLKTGLFAANLGIWCAGALARRSNAVNDSMYIVGHSMAMAQQHIKVLTKKFKEVEEESPDLYAFYDTMVIDDAMNQLKDRAHGLDDNDAFVRWRSSDPIVSHYGDPQTIA